MLRREGIQRHVMELAEKYDSGAEEWRCPTCGRRFLMQWPPHYKRIILEPGDEEAIHTGGRGGVHSASAALHQESDRLKPWLPDEMVGLADEMDGEELPGLSPELLAALEELDFSALNFDHEEE